VDEVLELVGLGAVAGRRAGGFSLGMSQRLGIAGALLGDPKVLLFDEPVNGLDPEGIQWIRRFMQELASQGRTVFVSSHLLSEMALTAADLVVIGRGRLISQTSTAQFIEQAGAAEIRVRSPQLDRLSALLTDSGAAVRQVDGTTAEKEIQPALLVSGMAGAAIGEMAAANQIALHELSPQAGSLEEAFMQMTGDSVDYRTQSAVG
jgi:ABC-2 type transport system ATP-binding protein